ncbi:MAG: hypothetical protein P1U56_22670 [Saprospiraceae bacterium]|nr:hypothetical protein [Saprospiraceae bacterium]
MKKLTAICLLLSSTILANAGIWPTLSIVELAIRSDRIVEAKYLGTDGNKSKFLIKDIQDQTSNVDTLILKELNRYFYDFSGFASDPYC